MMWLRASMLLAVVACCLGVHWFLTGGDDPQSGKPVAGAFLFFAGFGWAVVVRFVSWVWGGEK
jgi:hypothetical protein